MALTLDETLAGNEANSWVDLAYAQSYWTNHWNARRKAAFLALTNEAQTQLLIAACSIINGFWFTYDYPYGVSTVQSILHPKLTSDGPYKYDVTQALQFPRHIDVDASGAPLLLENVAMAQCEQAAYLATLDDSDRAARLMGISYEQLALGKGTFQQSQKREADASMIAPMAYEYLKHLFIRNPRRERAT